MRGCWPQRCSRVAATPYSAIVPLPPGGMLPWDRGRDVEVIVQCGAGRAITGIRPWRWTCSSAAGSSARRSNPELHLDDRDIHPDLLFRSHRLVIELDSRLIAQRPDGTIPFQPARMRP